MRITNLAYWSVLKKLIAVRITHRNIALLRSVAVKRRVALPLFGLFDWHWSPVPELIGVLGHIKRRVCLLLLFILLFGLLFFEKFLKFSHSFWVTTLA